MPYDLHIHSTVSSDSKTTMEAAVKKALSLGLTGLSFTDHLNLILPETKDVPDPHGYASWSKGYEEIREIRAAWGGQLDILHGMELAEITMDLERAKCYARAPDIDYLLGAVHMVRGYPDFYWMTFPDLPFCKTIMGLYLDESIRLAELNMVDAHAHIGYPQRYMAYQGIFLSLADYEEQLRHLFTRMAETGQALELNTSGLRQGTETTFPDLDALKLYRSCGGEMVTIGSDAHRVEHVASHLNEAKDLLQAAGFSHCTIFRQRKPVFIPL